MVSIYQFLCFQDVIPGPLRVDCSLSLQFGALVKFFFSVADFPSTTFFAFMTWQHQRPKMGDWGWINFYYFFKPFWNTNSTSLLPYCYQSLLCDVQCYWQICTLVACGSHSPSFHLQWQYKQTLYRGCTNRFSTLQPPGPPFGEWLFQHTHALSLAYLKHGIWHNFKGLLLDAFVFLGS